MPVEVLGRLGTRLKTEDPTKETIANTLLSKDVNFFKNLNTVLKLKNINGFILSEENANYIGELFIKHEKTRSIGLRRLTALSIELMRYYFNYNDSKNKKVEINKEVINHCMNRINSGIVDEDGTDG